MKCLVFLFALSLIITSCDWFKQKAKNTVHKSGEVVAKTGSEFVDGVAEGVGKTFENKAVLSGDLPKKLQVGKILIVNSDSASDNVLSAYFIFTDSLEQTITAKVFDESDQEYGRASLLVKGRKGEARYVDFKFDKRTNIDGKSKVTFE